MPSPVPVAAISWLLELPRDLGLDHDTIAASTNTQEVFPGWENKYDAIPAWDPRGYETWPRMRLRFRRAQVGIGMPTESVDRTFGDLRHYNKWQRARYRSNLYRDVRRGVKEWKTVCQLTRWYVGGSIPDLPENLSDPGTNSPYRLHFFELLDDLDLFLQAYGLIAGEIDVGALALHDLPASIPWLIDYRRAPCDEEVQVRGALRVHNRYPDLLPASGNHGAGREAAVIMATDAADNPFFTAYTLVFQAQAAARAGRRRQAVTDMGTAVESFVSELIRRGKAARGTADQEIEKLLREARWTDLYNRELLELLGIPGGQASAEHQAWWREDYEVRRQVVHAGYRPTLNEAYRAVSRSWDLFDWLGKATRAIPDLKQIGDRIRVKRK